MIEIDLHDEYRLLGVFYVDAALLLDEADETFSRTIAAVSAWSRAQHLYHILRANGMMLKGIQLICQGHRMADNEGEPNEAGRYVLTNGFIRGRGQAPDAVVPPDEVPHDVLLDSLARSRRKYVQTEPFLAQIPDASGRIPHHFLGMLNAAEWLRLTRLHAEHHLAIIHDIAGRQTPV